MALNNRTNQLKAIVTVDDNSKPSVSITGDTQDVHNLLSSSEDSFVEDSRAKIVLTTSEVHASLRGISETVAAITRSQDDKIAAFEKTLSDHAKCNNFLSGQVETLEERNKTLEEEVRALKARVGTLEKSLA